MYDEICILAYKSGNNAFKKKISFSDTFDDT